MIEGRTIGGVAYLVLLILCCRFRRIIVVAVDQVQTTHALKPSGTIFSNKYTV